MAIDKVLYRAHAHATGGRDGRARSSDGILDVRLAVPKEMGGQGGEATNPEQLFAAGYAACFLGALKLAASRRKVTLPPDVSIDSAVGIGPLRDGFGIEVDLKLNAPGMDKAQANELMQAAHQICPYSNATRNNVDVRLSVA